MHNSRLTGSQAENTSPTHHTIPDRSLGAPTGARRRQAGDGPQARDAAGQSSAARARAARQLRKSPLAAAPARRQRSQHERYRARGTRTT